MSSNITLSAATRQNLLSLQDTANLLATTQNRLSTGKKVNTALDNPVNFFTSQSLDSRSTALSTLLDGVSNGIQTIQAANQGITNIQKLTDQLKSTAQQALAASNSFTTKASSTTTALSGATASSLTGSAAKVTGSALTTSAVAAKTTAAADFAAVTGSAGQITINGNAIATDDGDDIDAVILKINAETATTDVSASKDGNKLVLTGKNDGANFTVGGTGDSASYGFTTTAVTVNGTQAGATPVGSDLATSLGFTANQDFTVNGSTVTVGAGMTLDQLAKAIGTATNGTVSASFASGQFSLTSKDGSTDIVLADGTGEVSKLGLTEATTTAGNALKGKTLGVQVGTGTIVNISFGAGGVTTLDQLNEQLEAASAQASIDSTGKLTITTTNEAGAESLSLTGTATGAGSVFTTTTAEAVLGGDGKSTRDKLVNDYNNLRTQIDQMARDASYNGVNLLNGDTLKVIFNETNTSSLSVKGTAMGADTLGISAVGTTDFQDANSINKVLSQLTSAKALLNSQAATYGSNLSVVQNRQDFTKGLINVLDTGSANLTNADMNAEAANSTALSTRNSLGISALSLANQAQQGVLQLLR